MAEYLIYFNQQWVGDHSEEWFRSRAPLAKAVVDEMREAGVYVFAGGLEDGAPVYSADATTGTVVMSDGPYAETKELLGGLTVVDVPTTTPPRCGPAGSRRGVGGPRRCAGSGDCPRPSDCVVRRRRVTASSSVGDV